MSEVILVYVREDGRKAQALADIFDKAGCSISDAYARDDELAGCGAAIALWSAASIRSRVFLTTLQRMLDAKKAVVASLIRPPPRDWLTGGQVFNLSTWRGDKDDPRLDGLFFSVDHRVAAARSRTLTASAKWQASAGWTAPLPTTPIRRSAPASPAAPKPQFSLVDFNF